MTTDNFRATQPPSKVLHIRNLPYETTEAELKELCTPFGRLAKTKLNVGANRNQAFVEFTDINSSIQMVTYFAGSAEPAKVRGKTVYLQYSTRQEIVNSSNTGETPSNVLLVTLENLTADTVITIDTLHNVFRAFGFVAKIATFEKSAGYQALVQYADSSTAQEARDTLDGRTIPKCVLPEGATPPQLRISFSAHTDLNVKFQSHRSRDYTNPYLPTAPTATDPTLGIGAPLTGTPLDGNVLLAVVENAVYPVTVDAIHTVFSPYGVVQKIAIFEKNGQTQALVQFSEDSSAANAKTALEGHAIYDGGYNRLKLSYSHHRDLNVKANNDRSWDYTTTPGTTTAATPQTAPRPMTSTYATPGGAPPSAYTAAGAPMYAHHRPPMGAIPPGVPPHVHGHPAGVPPPRPLHGAPPAAHIPAGPHVHGPPNPAYLPPNPHMQHGAPPGVPPGARPPPPAMGPPHMGAPGPRPAGPPPAGPGAPYPPAAGHAPPHDANGPPAMPPYHYPPHGPPPPGARPPYPGIPGPASGPPPYPGGPMPGGPPNPYVRPPPPGPGVPPPAGGVGPPPQRPPPVIGGPPRPGFPGMRPPPPIAGGAPPPITGIPPPFRPPQHI